MFPAIDSGIVTGEAPVSYLLYGAPEYQIKKLQRVMNASARLVYCAPKYCHVTPLLRELHWLPVRLRVDFKILLSKI